MKKTLHSWTIADLVSRIEQIEFPEFQREPTVWGLEKKKRLIDSILRGIDISLIYLAKNDTNTFDCIDGQQRINAILSYLGINKTDEDHNGFNLEMVNEVYEDAGRWRTIQGKRFDRLEEKYRKAILGYKVNVMTIEEIENPDELNLMFLRLQLGSPLRSGEKLHAMSGQMKEYVFTRLALHSYFERLSIPRRRYAKELVASQLLYNVYSYLDIGMFSRSRFEDLQSFFRRYSVIDLEANRRNADVMRSLDVVAVEMEHQIGLIRNRGLAVSVFLFVWSELLRQNRASHVPKFANFFTKLLESLKVQVERAKQMDIDPKYKELLTLQTSLTQATGDASSLQLRQTILSDYFEYYLTTGQIKTSAI